MPDLFRLAQVFFDIHGRSLPVRIEGQQGIVHWSYPLPLHVVDWANVYTIHDLIPLIHPGLTPIDPTRHRNLLQAIVRKAAGIVTVSEFSRREIAAELGPIRIPLADCSQPVDVRGEIGTLPVSLKPRGYFLILGSVETRKNIPAVIAAHQASGLDLPLVIAGPDGWGAADVLPLSGDPRVIRLSYLPADAIRALVSQARGLVMMSLAEGFGLPVAEAMALGTPVMTSDRGALAETAGGAALLVDPTDVGGIAAAFRGMATDDALWIDLRKAGQERAEAFTQSLFADRLGRFYSELAPTAR